MKIFLRGSQLVLCGRTDGHGKANVNCRSFGNLPKTGKKFTFRIRASFIFPQILHGTPL